MNGDLSGHPHPEDLHRARNWARDLLARQDWVILDTETTGLGSEAETVQIAVIAPDGAVLLNALVKPTRPIPPDATQIHGITDAMVTAALPFRDLHPALRALLQGRTVVIYNADYDTRILRQTAELAGLDWRPITVECAMLRYAAFVGQWNSYHGNYRWQRLPTGDHHAHDAVGDCKATLDVIRRMAGTGPNLEPAGGDEGENAGQRCATRRANGAPPGAQRARRSPYPEGQ